MSTGDIFDLHGRVAFISGASSGLGLHLAGVLARAGSGVALAARRADRTQAAAEELSAAGHQACAVPMDVTQASSIGPAFDAAEKALGAPIDILLNNAGVIYLNKFIAQEEAEVAKLFDTNIKGSFLVAQEAGRRMAAGVGGSIINMASTAGLRAAGFLSSYAASKAALISLSQVMALELAHKNVRVNALCPGNIETDMHQTFIDSEFDQSILKRIPQRRFGKPDDLDGAVLLMASDAGRYITGATLTVDGGQTLSWM